VYTDDTHSVRTSVCGGGEDHGKIENLSDRSMRHDVVLVQTWIPISCDVVEADLDIEDQKNLMMNVRCCTIIFRISDTYGVVLVDTLPWDGFNMLAATEERGSMIIPSPRTALARPAATRQIVEKNLILTEKRTESSKLVVPKDVAEMP
jgi:hypothetical protein